MIISISLGVFCGLGFAVRLGILEARINRALAGYRIPNVQVLRGGKNLRISARAVTVGDILYLGAGDVVPADCRLITSDGLQVLALTANEEGHPVYTPQAKQADAVYGVEDTVTQAPQFENMLYGGSEIVAGEAYAVVTAVGNYTHLGAMHAFDVPGDYHTHTQRTGFANAVQPYLRTCYFILFAALLPLSVIGMLVYADTYSLLRVFLSVSAWMGTSSTAFLMTHFAVGKLRLRNRFLGATDQNDRAVLKSDSAENVLAGLTDLFVMGHCGISDGKPHLYRCATGDGEVLLGERSNSASLQILCEAYLLQGLAKEQLQKGRRHSTDPFADLRRELTAACDFDSEAMRVRLTQVASLANDAAWGELLEVEMKNGRFRLLFTDRFSVSKQCTHFRTQTGNELLTPTAYERIASFVKSARMDGCRLQYVIRQEEDRLIFLGAVALREEIQSNLSSVIDELAQSGVRVSFFMREETRDELRYVLTSGLPERPVLASQLDGKERDLTKLSEKYRVFLGFTDAEIVETVKALQQSGRRIAVLGDCANDLRSMRFATLAVSCDRLQISPSGRAYQTVPTLETACQAVQRHADILIPRANRFGGGLAVMAQLIAECRALEQRMPTVFCFLLASRIVHLTAVVLAVLCGVGLPTGAQILFSGMTVEALGVLWLTAQDLPSTRLRCVPPPAKTVLRSILSKRGNCLVPLLSAFTVMLYTIVMYCCKLFDMGTCVTFLFCSILLLQLAALFQAARSGKFLFTRFGACAPVLSVLVPLLLFIAFSVAFPAFGAITQLGSWNTVSFCSLILAPCIYLLFSYFFSRTAK